MPSLAKTTIAAALSWSGAATWLGRKRAAMPLILGYHRVVEDVAAQREKSLPGMMISQRMLRAHLEWVAQRYRIVSLDELGAAMEQGEPCGHLAAVTFDDGYRDVYDHALPVLQQVGVPATVFVVSSLLETSGLPLHDELYEIVSDLSSEPPTVHPTIAGVLNGRRARRPGPITLIGAVRSLLALPPAKLRATMADLRAIHPHTRPPKELVTMDWDALRAMQRAGMTIGSHTHTHAMLDREDDQVVLDELVRSRSELEAGLGTPVRHLAYPDGRFNSAVVTAVAAAGYRFAYTICDHSIDAAPLLTIPRVMLWEGSCAGSSGNFSASIMHCHAASALPFPSRCSDDHGVRSVGES